MSNVYVSTLDDSVAKINETSRVSCFCIWVDLLQSSRAPSWRRDAWRGASSVKYKTNSHPKSAYTFPNVNFF